MGQAIFTIKTESTIKRQFDGLCNEFGMSEKEYLSAKGKKTFELLRKEASANGLSLMTLEEINEEISETRKLK